MAILEKVEKYVDSLFKDKLSSSYLYHNFMHTKKVVQSIQENCTFENLDEPTTEKLLIAGWFHDVGYVFANENHEDESIVYAKNFLKQEDCEDSYIDEICFLIESTKMNYEPKTLFQEIIKDADCSHMGKENYLEISENLRKEWGLVNNKTFTENEWCALNLDFLKNKHQFYTEFAKKNYEPIKKKNCIALETLIQNMEKVKDTETQKSKKEKKNKKEKEAQKFDRGIDTMFRVTLNNHTRLSEIADSKANILLSVNTIIISIVLSVLIPKLDNIKHDFLLIPTTILMVFSVISIIFAILSTRPKVNNTKITTQDLEEKKVNLLFFGNFSKLSLPQYETSLKEMMTNTEDVYNAMIRDLYYLGVVLDRKYKLLRNTYTVFMIGIIVSVASFIIAFRYGRG